VEGFAANRGLDVKNPPGAALLRDETRDVALTEHRKRRKMIAISRYAELLSPPCAQSFSLSCCFC